MKKLLLTAIAISTTFAATSSFAFGFSEDKCNIGGDKVILKQLELTDAQQKSLADVKDKANAAKKASMKTNMQAAQKALKEMADIVYADKFDEAAAKQVATEASSYQVKNQVEAAKARYDMLQVLTPEQRTKFRELETKNAQNCIKEFQEKKAKWEKRLNN